MALLLIVMAGAAWGQMQAPKPIPDLRQAPANVRATAVAHCRPEALYRLTFADGSVRPWTEIGLNLKVDSTEKGPPAGVAVLIPTGSVGDRAFLVFDSLESLKRMIQPGC